MIFHTGVSSLMILLLQLSVFALLLLHMCKERHVVLRTLAHKAALMPQSISLRCCECPCSSV